MPRIDEKSGEIVIRIVYDGMPEAGKTTNVQQLHAAVPLQRRGALSSPATTGRRTEFFDWVDFAGGFVDGRRVRCQLVSVPGQPQLLHRRRYLLETADVVVFVADSQPSSVDTNRESVTKLIELLAKVDLRVPPTVVVQANKQDLPGALRARTLAAELAVPVTTPVVPAVAMCGRGVMDTFVLAVRLATDRVRTLVVDGASLDMLGEDEASAEALHVAMLAVEQRETVCRAVAVDPVIGLRTRPNDVETAKTCRVPRPEALLAGHVWPPVKGRAAVAAASVGEIAIPEHAIDWAPSDPIELMLGDDWVLHSTSRWRHEDEAAARAELVAIVRRAVTIQELLPEGRAFFLGADEKGFRLWMLTPPVEPIATRLLRALAARDPRAVSLVLDDFEHARSALVQSTGEAALAGGCAGLAVQSGRAVILSTPGGGIDVDAHLESIAARAVARDRRATACLAEARKLAPRHRLRTEGRS